MRHKFDDRKFPENHLDPLKVTFYLQSSNTLKALQAAIIRPILELGILGPRLLGLDEEKAQMGFAIVYVDTVLESQLNPLLPDATVYLLEVQAEEHFPSDLITGRGLMLRPHFGDISSDSFDRVGIFYCRHDRFKDAEAKVVTLV
jgi:hypothetical protein